MAGTTDEQAKRLRLVAHNADWQYPAITEKRAFDLISRSPLVAPATYFGFPWASLFDSLDNQGPEADRLLAALQACAKTLNPGAVNITVCQHIRLPHHFEHVVSAKISHVFWSHAATHSRLPFVALHPFPLFPVEVPSPNNGAERRNLFSFVGAQAKPWYLTKSRTWILQELANDPRGLVIGRTGWHYDQIVYDFQIRKQVQSEEGLIDTGASADFRQALADSVFSLCPCGTGANSIRLWESIGAGAIPVILADTWSPPGDRAMWDAAALFCPETPEAVRALPDRLAAIAANPKELAARRNALKQLNLLYGPTSFIHDIRTTLIEITGAQMHAGSQDDAPPPGHAASLALIGRAACNVLTRRNGQSDGSHSQFALERAVQAISPDHAMKQALVRAQAHADAKFAADLNVPSLVRNPRLRLLLLPSAAGSPLFHPQVRAFARQHVDFVTNPHAADIMVVESSTTLARDLSGLGGAFAVRKGVRVVVLDASFETDGLAEAEYSPHVVPLPEINRIFAYDHIPVEALGNDDVLALLVSLFDRNIAAGAGAMLAQWQRASIDLLMAPTSLSRSGRGTFEAAAYRSDMARALLVRKPATGGRGLGATANPPSIERLAALDGSAKLLCCIKGAPHSGGISHWFLDAFATGAIPVCHVSPSHRYHDLVPSGSFLNVAEHPPQEAASLLDRFQCDREHAELHLEGQAQLRLRLANISNIVAERRRVSAALTGALASVLESPIKMADFTVSQSA